VSNVQSIERGRFSQRYAIHQPVQTDDGAGGTVINYIVKGEAWGYLREHAHRLVSSEASSADVAHAVVVVDHFHDISPGDLLSNTAHTMRVESRQISDGSPHVELRCRSDPDITKLLQASP
jgi:head-tail adaptor